MFSRVPAKWSNHQHFKLGKSAGLEYRQSPGPAPKKQIATPSNFKRFHKEESHGKLDAYTSLSPQVLKYRVCTKVADVLATHCWQLADL
jgi:hypothetical protein